MYTRENCIQSDESRGCIDIKIRMRHARVGAPFFPAVTAHIVSFLKRNYVAKIEKKKGEGRAVEIGPRNAD